MCVVRLLAKQHRAFKWKNTISRFSLFPR